MEWSASSITHISVSRPGESLILVPEFPLYSSPEERARAAAAAANPCISFSLAFLLLFSFILCCQTDLSM